MYAMLFYKHGLNKVSHIQLIFLHIQMFLLSTAGMETMIDIPLIIVIKRKYIENKGNEIQTA